MDKHRGGSSKRPFAFMRWTSLLLVGVCIFSLYFHLGQYTEEDKAAYDKLVSREDTPDMSETKVSKQQRNGIQKNIFIDQDRQIQMKSAASELSLEKRGRHVDIVEHLHDVTCWLQDHPDLIVFHAADASYHYKDGYLSANDVHAKRCVASEQISAGMPQYAEDNRPYVLAASAEQVNYHQGVMTLSGNAQIENELGILSADRMVIPELDKAKNAIEEMTADGAVTMRYGDELTVASDHAVFQRNRDAVGALSGMITLTCNPDRLCQVTTSEGDEVHAKKITIDTEKRELHFTSPKGVLTSVSEASKPVHFTANHLVWDDLTSKLRLMEDVQIFQEGSHFKAANDVLLVLIAVEGKKVLHGIETKGEASLTYSDSTANLTNYFLTEDGPKDSSLTSQNEYVLQSYGSLRIDHQKQEVKLRSPELPDGSVVEGKQVHMRDYKGEIYADRAFLKYAYVEQKMVPVRIVLQGNVKMTATASEKNKKQQYVLADRADFMPQSKEMVLKSDKGKRVLLFDQGSNLEVSAPGIKFNRDKAVDKEAIQGIGDVRFHFVDAECDQLHRHFPLHEKRE